MPAPTQPEGTYVGGTSGNDTLAGGNRQDKIYGWGGRDALDGGGGDDWLDGGAGSDSLTGGTGADRFVLRKGEAAGDWIRDFDAASGDRIEFHGFAEGARLEQGSGDTWQVVDADGTTAIRITGTVDAGSYDFLDSTPVPGPWPAPEEPTGTYLGGTSGDNVLTGTAQVDKIYGWGGYDTLNGGGGNDWLDGGHQDDVLDGGAGADSLTGGTGADLFVLNKGDADGDWIHDFNAAGGDRIAFRGFGTGARLEHASGDLWNIVHAGGEETIRINGEVTAGSYTFEDAPSAFSPILFFSAVGDDAGRELWGYDGTTFQRLTDIAPGGVSDDGTVLREDANPDEMVWTGSDLLFEASSGGPPRHLWRYDGDTGEVVPVTYPDTGEMLETQGGYQAPDSFLSEAGDIFYFGTRDGGSRLWQLDTETATVAEVPAGADVVGRPSTAGYYLLTEYDGDLIVTGGNDDHHFTQSLWRFDPESGQTSLFHDLQAFVFSHAIVDDDLLLVSVTEGLFAEPRHVTVVDADTGETIPINADPGVFEHLIDGVGIHAVGGNAAYMSFERYSEPEILVRYDSDTNTITQLTDETFTLDHTLQGVLLDHDFYFTAQGDAASEQLWRWNDATGAVERLTDFQGTAPADQVGDLFAFGDDLVFAADDGVHGFELYRYDTSSGTTERLTDLAPGAADSDPRDFAVIDGDLYFTARTGEDEPTELWKLDGDTGAITNLDPDGLFVGPGGLTPATGDVLIA